MTAEMILTSEPEDERKVRVLLENDQRLRRLVERAEERIEKMRQAMSRPPGTRNAT